MALCISFACTSYNVSLSISIFNSGSLISIALLATSQSSNLKIFHGINITPILRGSALSAISFKKLAVSILNCIESVSMLLRCLFVC